MIEEKKEAARSKNVDVESTAHRPQGDAASRRLLPAITITTITTYHLLFTED